MNNKKEELLIVAPFRNNFIDLDAEILSSDYSVSFNVYNWKSKSLLPYNLIKQFLFLLLNLKKYQKVLVHFGGYWSFLPVVLGRLFAVKTFIIVHGTDCASIKSISYGSLRKKPIKYFVHLSFKYCYKILAVSSSLKYIDNTKFYNKGDSIQGIKFHFPKLSTDISVIENAVKVYKENVSEINKEANSFISVFSRDQFILKGGDLIIALAKRMHNCKFYMVGIDKHDVLELDIPSNVYLLGRLERSKLDEYYSKSEFHFQLSIFEGFGLALAEAMSYKCIPIVSFVNILPEIIGESGFVLNKRDVDELYNIVNIAIKSDNKLHLGELAKEKILNNFTIEKRKRKLLIELSS